jgi:hypothetical protein
MPLTMSERNAVTNETKERYRKASKKLKGQILDEFCELCNYNRKYAARKLRSVKESRSYKKIKKSLQKTKGRKRTYGAECIEPLVRVWAVLDFACSRRMAAGMADALDAMIRHNRIALTPDVEAKLKKMSASTIDRLLASRRKAMCLKGRSGTKPGSLLKRDIPIRTGTEWDEDMVGFVEMDTVLHCGKTTRGQYCVSLDVTDIKTCWTEQHAALNKAQAHVFAAIKECRARMPFVLLGIDTDGGSEFINNEMYRYCKAEHITFTRGRSYKKNDGAHIEQKNWSIIRQTIGYGRFETQTECDLLNAVYDRLRLLTNFFMPSQKLTSKKRDGARIIRKLDEPKTPYRRVLDSDHISDKAKEGLTKLFYTLDPYELRREVTGLVNELYRTVQQQTGPAEALGDILQGGHDA